MNQTKQLNQYINGNVLDLDEVIDDFTPYIKTIIYNMVGNNLSNEDKEEILSDTFFILWKNRDKNILSLEAYIAGITKNLIREKLRKREITSDFSEYENAIGCDDNIEVFSEKREYLNKLKISYKSLSKIDFKILEMYYYQSKSIKNIANELNISETNIKTKLYRIRKKLKKFLQRRDDHEQ